MAESVPNFKTGKLDLESQIDEREPNPCQSDSDSEGGGSIKNDFADVVLALEEERNRLLGCSNSKSSFDWVTYDKNYYSFSD